MDSPYFKFGDLIKDGTLKRQYRCYHNYESWEKFCVDPFEEQDPELSLSDVPYVNSRGETKAWFRVETPGVVSVDARLPGYLDFLAEGKRKKGPFNFDYEVREGRIYMKSGDALETKRVLKRAASFGGIGGYLFALIPAEEWRLLQERYSIDISAAGDTLFFDSSKEREVQEILSRMTRLPFPVLRLQMEKRRDRPDERDPGCMVILPGPRVVLAEAYRQIYELCPYDVDLRNKYVVDINKAYDLARENLKDRTTLKVDYRFLVLDKCTPFARIHTSRDLPTPLPRYWYNPNEVSGSLEDLMDLLAIEEAWAPEADRYQLKVWFPAGTMFLVASAESQETTKGGGTEYILVYSPSEVPWLECVAPLT